MNKKEICFVVIINTNMSTSPAKTLSPSWKRPDEVMKLHRLKWKKNALQARMNRTEFCEKQPERSSEKKSEESSKRKNPFKRDGDKKFKTNLSSCELDSSSENTLFQLLQPEREKTSISGNLQTSFSSILSNLTFQDNKKENVEVEKLKGEKYIPIDWTLKSKLRFMSPKPFEWNQKLRTCEEASGITGFVRCLDTGLDSQETSLDTSPNARFHQCCLVWQHPVLPWVSLFPRFGTRSNSTTASVASDSVIKDCLHQEWSESFRSLFQLVRARQCPFFYVCSNTYTCLFRAAGICGHTEIHALITPTTRGFRQMLKEEDVVFRMPLRKSSKVKRLSSENTTGNDTGYDTLDSEDTTTQDEENAIDSEDDTAEEWLESMGIAADEIQKLNKKQMQMKQSKEGEVDRTPESLVYVEGVEVQALFNFLMNCKSSVATTGPLAGIPPTLLAPVAFHGAVLKPLKVRQNVVAVQDQKYHSVELQGPILPHTIPHLCCLLEKTLEEFSATFANIDSTRAFSLAANIADGNFQNDLGQDTCLNSPVKRHIPNVFGKENLSDCGLQSTILENFTMSDKRRITAIDSLKRNSDNTYTWS